MDTPTLAQSAYQGPPQAKLKEGLGTRLIPDQLISEVASFQGCIAGLYVVV